MRKAPMSLLLGSLIAALAASSAIWADETPTEKAIKYRQSVMTLVGANFSPMGAMMKGEIPYDATAFARYASDLGAVSSIDILRGFPPDTEGEGSKAKGEIWLNWEDFQDKMEAFRTEAGKLAEVVDGGERDTIKAQFSATAKTCKSCHDDYKE